MKENILKKLNEIEKRYNEINSKLVTMEIISNSKELMKLEKEQKKISLTFNLYKEYKNIKTEISEAEQLISIEKDSQMIEELKLIIQKNKKRILELENELIQSLVEKDPLDEKNVIFEIKGAVGGDEANIFVGDLYDMYQKYFLKNNMKIVEVIESRSDSGGFSNIKFKVIGEGIFGKLKYEAGVHRVQRIPATENRGRVHTSTVTVSVLPEADEIDFEINNSDLRIDTYRSSGAGGQHVNKTDSAVRITHIPTGIVVASQDGRSQHDNKSRALEELRNKLYMKKIEEEQSKQREQKKSAIGNADRSEKIRTYNYPQNRVTDHRINSLLL